MWHTCGEPNEIEMTAAHRLFYCLFPGRGWGLVCNTTATYKMVEGPPPTDTVQGCAATGYVNNASDHHDYCYDPAAGSTKLGHCEGDCDGDTDCAAGLSCRQRGSSGEMVPGCVAGGTGDVPTADYCYDPALATAYFLQPDGTCADAVPAGAPVVSTDECSWAAIYLGLNDTTVHTTTVVPRPEGCHWSQGSLLKFSAAAANVGRGAEACAGTASTCVPVCRRVGSAAGGGPVPRRYLAATATAGLSGAAANTTAGSPPGNVYMRMESASASTWGGECMCPNGQVYAVSDAVASRTSGGLACGPLHCYGGAITKGCEATAMADTTAHGMGVTCGVSNAGAGAGEAGGAGQVADGVAERLVLVPLSNATGAGYRIRTAAGSYLSLCDAAAGVGVADDAASWCERFYVECVSERHGNQGVGNDGLYAVSSSARPPRARAMGRTYRRADGIDLAVTHAALSRSE